MEYRNPEHYPDPTAGKAIENIEQEEERMKRLRRRGAPDWLAVTRAEARTAACGKRKPR